MPRRVLALGLFQPVVADRVVDRGMKGVIRAARASFPEPEVEIVTIHSLTDFDEDFALLSDEFTQTHAGGKFRGIASGYFVQEALEGGHGITDIHYDLTGVTGVLLPTHAGSELRSLIAHIRAFHPRQVDIHFRTEGGMATMRRDATELEGATLPGWLAERFITGSESNRRAGTRP
jgi:hypothetical protein